MAAGKAHSDFFRDLAAFMVRTVNDAQFQVDLNLLVNIGPGFHYSFLENWLTTSVKGRRRGVIFASLR
jgi:hypothetical protein